MNYSVEIEYEHEADDIRAVYRGIGRSPEERRQVAKDLRDIADLLEDDSIPMKRLDN